MIISIIQIDYYFRFYQHSRVEYLDFMNLAEEEDMNTCLQKILERPSNTLYVFTFDALEFAHQEHCKLCIMQSAKTCMVIRTVQVSFYIFYY